MASLMNTQVTAATRYMEEHATILRWTTPLQDLLALLEAEIFSKQRTCRFYPIKVNRVASEVISSTLCLSNELFNPVVLWSTRSLAEEATRHGGLLAREPMILIRDISIVALRTKSDGPCRSYSEIINKPIENRYAHFGS
jgi:hypothetical protein